MTVPINLTDFIAVSELESDTIVAYEQLLSRRKKKQMRYRGKEIDALARLVKLCELSASNSKNLFNGFAYSYRIPQISKEFDLLKSQMTELLRLILNLHKSLDSTEEKGG